MTWRAFTSALARAALALAVAVAPLSTGVRLSPSTPLSAMAPAAASTPIFREVVLDGGLEPRNISRGEIATGQVTPAVDKTRLDARVCFPARVAAGRIAFVYANRYITITGETNGAGPVTINLAEAEKGSARAHITYGGSRSTLLASGSDLVVSDWTALPVAVGDTVCHRVQADAPNGWVSSGTQSGDQTWNYDPAVTGNTIDATGAMSAPTGGVSNQVFAPVLMIGEVKPGVTAVMGVGDSIMARSNDFVAVSGVGGGGFARRAFATMGVPYLNASLAGRELADFVAAPQLITALARYHTIAISEMSTNDITSNNSATVLARAQFTWSTLRAGGVKQVFQTTTLPSVTLTDFATSLGAQTPRSGFASGGTRDILNAAWTANIGQYGLTGVIDLSAAVQEPTDHTKWALRPYASTLPSGAASGATSITLADAVGYGETLIADPGGANQSTGDSKVTTAGSNTTVTISSGFGVTQSTGAVVKGTPTRDGIHPEPMGHAAMAAALITAMTPYVRLAANDNGPPPLVVVADYRDRAPRDDQWRPEDLAA